MVLWRWLCVVQFLILLLMFSWLGLTGQPGNYVPMFNDKLMHTGGYFAAAFSISFAFPRWHFLGRALFLILFSVGIEIGQHFLPPRTFDIGDIIANSTGVLLGLLAVAILEKKFTWFKKFLYLSQKDHSL